MLGTGLTFEGDTGIVGRAVIVHAEADDFETQPTGAAGARIAIHYRGSASDRERYRLAAENSAKGRVLAALLHRHRADRVLVIGQYLDQQQREYLLQQQMKTIQEELGRFAHHDYMVAFGLGQRTALDFPGESPGILKQPEDLWGSERVTVAYGQGLSSTPIQMAAAVNEGLQIRMAVQADEEVEEDEKYLGAATLAKLRSGDFADEDEIDEDDLSTDEDIED